MKYLRLVRYQNLLLLALAQFLVRYGIIIPMGADVSLSNFQFTLLILATVLIAAAGNLINDFYDIHIDRVNKPEQVLIGKSVSPKTANNLYIALTASGVGIGFYLANSIGKPEFAALFIAVSATLYIYASNLKAMLLVGNLIISLLVAISILLVPIFDLMSAITPENKALNNTIFRLILQFAGFAFFTNFIREIVKDLLDINGDKKGNINSLPILIGRKRTVKIVFLLAILLLFCVLYFMNNALYDQKTPMLYFLFAIVAPLIYFIIKSWDASKNKEYRLLSLLLKVVMTTGVLAMLLYRYFIF